MLQAGEKPKATTATPYNRDQSVKQVIKKYVKSSKKIKWRKQQFLKKDWGASKVCVIERFVIKKVRFVNFWQVFWLL